MSLLWHDGLDRFGATVDLDLFYTRNTSGGSGAATYVASGGVTGGGGGHVQVSCNNSFRCSFNRNVSGTLSSGGWAHTAFWFKWVTISSPFTIRAASIGTNLQAGNINTSAPGINVSSAGVLSVNRHGDATVVGTSVISLVANTWYHIEYAGKYNTNASGGRIKLWVNGNIVIDTNGTDTNTGTVPSSIASVYWGLLDTPNNNTYDVRFEDPVVWDEAGTDFVYTQMCSSYLHVIEARSPDADDSVQFTPSTGSNFQNVDDPAFHNGDTDYNSSTTVGHIDRFTVANLATTPAVVFGLGVKTVAKIDVAGTASITTRMTSGSTLSESANRSLTTVYQGFYDPFGKDPDTTLAWGTSAPDSVKTGYKYAA